MTKENEINLLLVIAQKSMANTSFMEKYGIKCTKCEAAFKGYEDDDDPPDAVVEEYERLFEEEFAEQLSKILEKDQSKELFYDLIYGLDF